MNNFKEGLSLFLSPYGILVLASNLAFITQLKKKRFVDDSVYNILKEDAVSIYNQSLDETKQQPLIHLLQEKSKSLDPELKKRLELYAQWQKDDYWVIIYNFMPIVFPSCFSVFCFPKFVSYAFMCYTLATSINYENEMEILTGGKIKSYYPTDLLPKNQKINKIFTYFTWGVMAMALTKLGIHKYKFKAIDKVITQWRNKQRK